MNIYYGFGSTKTLGSRSGFEAGSGIYQYPDPNSNHFYPMIRFRFKLDPNLLNVKIKIEAMDSAKIAHLERNLAERRQRLLMNKAALGLIGYT